MVQVSRHINPDKKESVREAVLLKFGTITNFARQSGCAKSTVTNFLAGHPVSEAIFFKLSRQSGYEDCKAGAIVNQKDDGATELKMPMFAEFTIDDQEDEEGRIAVRKHKVFLSDPLIFRA